MNKSESIMLQRHHILSGIWAMDREFATNHLPLVASFLRGQNLTNTRPVASAERMAKAVEEECRIAVQGASGYEISDYGWNSAPEDAPMDSIAIIEICGTITMRDQECGPSGMITKAAILKRCEANSNIRGIILKIDSGGGEAHAMDYLIKQIRTIEKPIVAFIDYYACSAAYGIASTCDWVVASSETTTVGSIGTYITLVDFSEYYKKEGINIIDIYATLSTDKNSLYTEALKGNLEPLRARIDVVSNAFIGAVSENRKGKIAKKEVWNSGKVFYAADALIHGLIDGIDSLENTLNYFND
ncbi:MAG: S49 family peptidase [Enterobacteriaceae bacterium]